MQTFEMLLILFSIAFIICSLYLNLVQLSCGILIVTLATLSTHMIIEGLRWQLMGVYLYLLVCFVTRAPIFHNGMVSWRRSVIPRSRTRSLGVYLASISLFLGEVFPVIQFPDPDGTFDTGVMHMTVIDEGRNEPFLVGADDRRIGVTMYYPAASESLQPAGYHFRGSLSLARSFSEALGLPGWLLGHLPLGRIQSVQNARPLGTSNAFRVVIFSHGGGTSSDVHVLQMEHLASHGYVVVSINHPYIAGAALLDGKVISHREATPLQGELDPARAMVRVMAADVIRVLERLHEMNDDAENLFFQRLRLDAVGLMGHSLGGAVAFDVLGRIPEVRASVNLDGNVYSYPDPDFPIDDFLLVANDGFFLDALLSNETFVPRFEELSKEEQAAQSSDFAFGSAENYRASWAESQRHFEGLREVVLQSGNLYALIGCDHMMFTDIGLFFQSALIRRVLGFNGSTDPMDCLKQSAILATQFFDRRLGGEDDGEQGSMDLDPDVAMRIHLD